MEKMDSHLLSQNGTIRPESSNQVEGINFYVEKSDAWF